MRYEILSYLEVFVILSPFSSFSNKILIEKKNSEK